MSTYMPKAGDINRKWYLLDAEGKSLGRVASQAAAILRGKHKPTFAPHADCGDHVIIINCSKAVLTGRKLEQKTYKWHTGWISGLKEIKYADMMKKEPQRAMMIAVNGMLPNNTLGRKALTRLRVYPGCEHRQQAQKPVSFETRNGGSV
jgi:large subunit ribosomal protein L13